MDWLLLWWKYLLSCIFPHWISLPMHHQAFCGCRKRLLYQCACSQHLLKLVLKKIRMVYYLEQI
jgi:hypothetical protein